MRICIIGSGIAGLSATYLLANHHEVTIYEAAASLGMDAHSVDVDIGHGKSARVDMPLRVFSKTYYPNLTNLYQTVGVQSVPENYCGSFTLLKEKEQTQTDSNTTPSPFFSYRNLLMGGLSLPFISWKCLFSPRFWSVVYYYLRFHSIAPQHLLQNKLHHLTLLEYLQQEQYSHDFIHHFLIPTVCAICTCSSVAAQHYPADIIVQYLVQRFLHGVRRASGGTKEVVQKLSAGAKEIRLNSPVKRVEYIAAKDHIEVEDMNGKIEIYDHAIIATQAYQALKFLKNASPDQVEALSKIPYERSTVITHTSTTLMPSNRSDWRSVNFMLDDSYMPCVSIFLNEVGLIPRDARPVFQTWAPNFAPPASDVICQSDFDRPIVTKSSREALSKLKESQGKNRFHFVGSYSMYSVPLLEIAVSSSLEVVQNGFGISAPFPQSKPFSFSNPALHSKDINRASRAATIILRVPLLLFIVFLFIVLKFVLNMF